MKACILKIELRACCKYRESQGNYQYYPSIEGKLSCEHHPTIPISEAIKGLPPRDTEEAAVDDAEDWLGEIANQEALMAAIRDVYDG